MRDTDATIGWYRANESWPGSIGFDPDGMCLKICRTARGLPSLYPSAISAQVATPAAHRVKAVRDLRRGMVVYYDDPADSNPYGHIVTVVARKKSADPDDLSSLLVRTNSVVSNRIVVVDGGYFQRHWGDEYQFGATWLNGQAIPDLAPAPEPAEPVRQPALSDNPTLLRAAAKNLRDAIRVHEREDHPRLVRALRRDLASLEKTIARFS